MAQVKDQEIQKELDASKKPLRQVYYFFGPEQFKIREFTQQIQKRLGDGIARELFYGDTFDFSEFRAACENFSLFDSGKLLIVRNADGIAAKHWEKLPELLLSNLPGTTIVFQGESLDGRKKHAQAMGKAKDTVAVVRCEFVEERDFFVWARELAALRKKKIAMPATQLLWERVGPSLYELDQSIEKSALFGFEAPSIEVEHVAAVVARTRQEVVFEYTDAVSSCDKKRALEQLSHLYQQGEEPIAIVALLARQYRWMLEIAVRLEARERAEDINRDLGLFPKLAKALHAGAKRQGKAGVLGGLGILRATDFALKSSGEPPRLLLDRMTLSLMP